MQAKELVGEKKGNDNGAYEREAQTTCTMIRKYIALLLLLLLYRDVIKSSQQPLSASSGFPSKC